MKSALYHQLNPFIRIKENELLTPETFDQLIRAEDLSEVQKILAGTTYGQYLSDVTGPLENVLGADRSANFAELAELAPDQDVVWIYTMRYTFHNLKALTKAYYAKENYDHLYRPDGIYRLEDVKNAIETGKSAVLAAELMVAITEVRDYMAESHILQGIDVIYDRNYLKLQRIVGERINDPELLDEIISFIDLTNIMTTLRCVMQDRSSNFMSTVLSSSGSISKTDLMTFAQQDLAQLKEFLLESRYGELLQPVFAGEEIDFALLDRLTDNYLSDKYNQAQTMAFGPLPLLAFLNAKNIERKNLRLIIVGKRSGFTQEQIKERMRDVYDL